MKVGALQQQSKKQLGLGDYFRGDAASEPGARNKKPAAGQHSLDGVRTLPAEGAEPERGLGLTVGPGFKTNLHEKATTQPSTAGTYKPRV